MSKVVSSPVEAFPGTVTLHEPLTYPQSIAFEDAIEASREATTRRRADYALLPGLLACVEAWSLENFPEVVGVDNFPSTPAVQSAELIGWLVEEIVLVYSGGESVPSEQ